MSKLPEDNAQVIEQMKSIVKDNLDISLDQIQQQLHTSIVSGLDEHYIDANRNTYGENRIPQRPATPFWRIYIDCFKDPILIILLISSIVSIVIGSAVPEQRKEGGYIDGIAIIIAVLIVSLVGSINDYSKEKQFRKLSAVKDNRNIQVLRRNIVQQINVYDLVVGDICCLEQGEMVPADGVLCTKQVIKMDQSQVTGESDAIGKNEQKPHIISGTLVSEGSGKIIITAVGIHSLHGETMMALQEENDIETPLQTKLNFLVKIVGYVGVGVAVAVFVVLIIRFFAEGKHLKLNDSGQKVSNSTAYSEWVTFLILSITIIVVAIPEGLPLAVTISLAYSMKKMIKDQCLVRKLQSCETCGSVSVICSDKTGTLTQNQMRVTNIWNPSVNDSLLLNYKPEATIFNQLLSYNASLSSNCQLEDNKVVGSKTSGAFMLMSRDIFGIDYRAVRHGLDYNQQPEAAIAFQIDFSSKRKRANIVVDTSAAKFVDSHQLLTNFCSKKYISLVKGASEILLEKCQSYIDNRGEIQILSQEIRQNCENKIQEFANKSLRTLIIAYQMVDNLPFSDDEKESIVEKDLIFQMLLGVQDPLRPGVTDAIKHLAVGGIRTIMVTGDNYNTAIAISKDAGIIPQNASSSEIQKLAIQGPELRKMSDDQVDLLLQSLCCVARCQPTDKFRVVQRLQQIGHVVAATGDGSNDAPQLKESDVGLAMGIAGTEIAKEASDIVILDDNFVSIVSAVKWGRAVMQNIRKFVQFQITVNVVALFITFLGSAVLSSSPLTSIQLLYVNLIMDSLGSLALATEGPTADVMEQKPIPRKASIINPGMMRNIIVVSLYQLAIILIMMFDGVGDIITMTPKSLTEEFSVKYRYTSIYNFFIFVQLINLINSRRLGSQINVFQGMCHTPLFSIVFVACVIVQCIIMFVPGLRDVFKIFNCTGSGLASKCKHIDDSEFKAYGISWQTWVLDIGAALVCLIVHLFGRLFHVNDEYSPKKEIDSRELKRLEIEKKQASLVRAHSCYMSTEKSRSGEKIENQQQIFQQPNQSSGQRKSEHLTSDQEVQNTIPPVEQTQGQKTESLVVMDE